VLGALVCAVLFLVGYGICDSTARPAKTCNSAANPYCFSQRCVGDFRHDGNLADYSAAATEYESIDLPFFELTGLIVASAFSLVGWYGWQLRAVDWTAENAE
jgi:hypothetical protein